jgi:hypothetical protein
MSSWDSAGRFRVLALLLDIGTQGELPGKSYLALSLSLRKGRRKE